jgi:uncharacterized protein YjbK
MNQIKKKFLQTFINEAFDWTGIDCNSFLGSNPGDLRRDVDSFEIRSFKGERVLTLKLPTRLGVSKDCLVLFSIRTLP